MITANRLTDYCERGGCSAKVNAAWLRQIVQLWDGNSQNGNVLIDSTDYDDAGVFSLGETLLVQSIDVITPVVDDPYHFGQIAAAHALSDIYAKGARPLYALNFLGVPLVPNIKRDINLIIQGASDAMGRAGVSVLGGHTLLSAELLVGFAVTGTSVTDKLIPLAGAEVGDKLVLTKPIGTGLVIDTIKRLNQGYNGTTLAESEIKQAISTMSQLNQNACELMIKYQANACTDITGFGLMGHLVNMVRASHVGAKIQFSNVPKLPFAERLLHDNQGFEAILNNMSSYHDVVTKAANFNGLWSLLFVPETSGGLLISLPSSQADRFMDEASQTSHLTCAIIGEVIERPSSAMVIIEN